MMQYLKRNRAFVVLLAVVFLIHVVFIPGFHELWWDSGVYVGMGKHLFSGGSMGLWEHIRPPLLPAVLGFLWFLGLDVAFFGMLLELFFSLGAVVLLYHITKHYFQEEAALVASAIFSLSSIFFYLSFHLYTEIPAAFFVLLGIYLFVLKRYYFSGLALAAAFLAKFPAGLFLLVLLLVLLLDKDIRNSLKISAGFFAALLPVLIAYQAVYGNALLPFIDAKRAINLVLGCNVLRFQPWWQYFYWIYSESVLHLFALIGVIVFFADFRKKNLLPLLCVVVPFAYFSQMHCRDYRYLAMFIPFIAVFSALGIVCLLDSFKRYTRQVFAVVLLVVICFSVFTGVLFYIGNENTNTNPAAEGYFSYLAGKNASREVWTSNPLVSFYTDVKLHKIYYPVYDAGVSTDFYDYLAAKSRSVEYVFLDNCGGGIICAQDDWVCNEKNRQMLDLLDTNFNRVYNEKSGACFYLIYRN